MLEDHEAPTAEQRLQLMAGTNTAMQTAIAALIATHPDPAAFSKMLDGLARSFEGALVTGTVLQADDGFRDAYSSTMRVLRSVIPQR